MSPYFKPSRLAKPNVSNRVRIIGGQWRSRMIDFPDGEGLRPTASRVRETLFNWLGQSLHDRHCLDLFAGSGALGFEAASRGAASVVMVEKSKMACLALETNREKLKAGNCRIVTGDALTFLATNREKFDIVFLDPPFASELMPALLARIQTQLTEGGVVYAEFGAPPETVLAIMNSQGWEFVKRGKAGVVHFALLSKAESAT